MWCYLCSTAGPSHCNPLNPGSMIKEFIPLKAGPGNVTRGNPFFLLYGNVSPGESEVDPSEILERQV